MANDASGGIAWRSAHFRVGDRVVDAAANEISHDGSRVIVRDKVMAGLIHLAANSDRVVTKDELLAALWPGQTPSDESLTQVIAELRRALGDTAKQAAAIRTVPKRGYRLVAPIEFVEPAPVLAVAMSVPVSTVGRLSSFMARRPQLTIALMVGAMVLQNAFRTLIHNH